MGVGFSGPGVSELSRDSSSPGRDTSREANAFIDDHILDARPLHKDHVHPPRIPRPFHLRAHRGGGTFTRPSTLGGYMPGIVREKMKGLEERHLDAEVVDDEQRLGARQPRALHHQEQHGAKPQPRRVVGRGELEKGD